MHSRRNPPHSRVKIDNGRAFGIDKLLEQPRQEEIEAPGGKRGENGYDKAQAIARVELPPQLP